MIKHKTCCHVHPLQIPKSMIMKRTNYILNINFLFKALLGYIAYFAIFPPYLPAILNKFRGVKIKNPFKVYIAPLVTIDTLYPELVTIEEGVYITRGVAILSHFNPTSEIVNITKIEIVKTEVLIKQGAFLGVNSIILPGVHIGRCAIVGAGSVVTNDVPDYYIVQGNPAKKIGRLPKSLVKESLINNNS